MSNVTNRAGSPAASMRVDAAHGREDAVAELPDDGLEVERMQRQAAELAERLRVKEQELTRREAQLNARTAQLENDLRNSRLWWQQREQEFARQEEEFRGRNEALQRRVTALSAAEVSADREGEQSDRDLKQRAQEIEEQAALLEQHAEQLAGRAQKLDELERSWETTRQRAEDEWLVEEQRRTRQRLENEELHRRMLRGIERRRAALDGVAATPADTAADTAAGSDEESTGQPAAVAQLQALLKEQLRQLEAERSEWKEICDKQLLDLRQQKSAWTARQERAAEDLDSRRKALDVRADCLDKQRLAVQKVRQDVLYLHRESLEMRFVAEQLWAQARDKLPATEMTRCAAGARRKLADHYRLEHQALAEQRLELQQLTARLDQQREQLVQQRGELQGWVRRQQADIEEQAARLIAREQELRREGSQLRDARQQWSQQRLAYQGRIQELVTQLGRGGVQAGKAAVALQA